MSYRKCLVCNGTGIIHGTPKLTVEGLAVPPKPDQMVLSREDDPRGSYGLSVGCWKCNFTGWIQESLNKGDTHGGL